jgi:hypothetical protein
MLVNGDHGWVSFERRRKWGDDASQCQALLIIRLLHGAYSGQQ